MKCCGLIWGIMAGLAFSACLGPRSASTATGGEVTGVGGTAYSEPTPYGMVFVKKGSLKIGTEETDSLWGMTIPTREISVDGFWMDANEVSNAKYRQFVFWVRDSIIRERLADPAYAGRRDLQDRGGQVRESCDSLSELEKADTLETPERRRVEGHRKCVRDESGYGGAYVGCAPDELPL